jgi:invasin-like protein/Big-like domain-containing protein/calcineurin-like phosphoesterase family protein
VALAAPGSGNTLTQPATSTDANGVATGTLRSTVAGTKTVSATANGTAIVQTAVVTVTPGPVSTAQSTVSAAPSSIVAGSGTSTIRVTVRDASGNPISGATVVLAATGSRNTLTQPVGLTDATGVATGTLSSTVAGDKTVSATANGTALPDEEVVTVTPGPVSASQSTLTASPSPIVPGPSGVSTIVVTARDAFANPVSGATVVLSATGTGNSVSPAAPTDADGEATGTLSSSVAETKTISATVNGTALTQTTTVTVTTATAIVQKLLTAGNDQVNRSVYTTAPIAPAPNTLITVAVLGQNTTSAPPSPTLSGGGMTAWTEVMSVTFDAVGTPLKRLTIFRAMSAGPGSGPITITSGANLSNCQWLVSQWSGVDLSGVNGAGAIVQTGSSRADAIGGLTVPLAAFGNAGNVAYGVFGVAASVVSVTPGAGFVEIGEQPSVESASADLEAEWTTNDNTIDATWSSSLNASALGVEIKAAPTSSVSPSQSTVAAAPSSITAGSGTSTVTVTVKDASGNPVSGATVVLATTGSGNTLTQPAAPTDVNGVATGSLSSAVTGTKTVSATANGTAITQTATVTVTSGSVSAAQSTVTAIPSFIAPSTGTSTITVTVRDLSGNPVSGATVVLAATGSGNTLTQPASPTNSSGVATGTLRSTVTGTKTVSATANGVSITQSATVTVSAAVQTLVGAGDIAVCGRTQDEATALLLDGIPGTVFTAGDNVYNDGTAEEYANCYDPNWGRHKARTRPSAGNHDYHTPGAAGYFGYYGAAAGDPATGYYSYDLGDWHIVVLNSRGGESEVVSAGSPQEQWLRADLAASTKTCTLAYWHHPRFSSGANHGGSVKYRPLWQALYDFGAELVVVGHEHVYERFAPQTPAGAADPTGGIRQFTVGTGGSSLYSFDPTPAANSEARNSTAHGVLKLTLHSTGYEFEFVPIAGQTFTDSGRGSCH